MSSQPQPQFSQPQFCPSQPQGPGQQSAKKKIFITGASGQTGMHVLKHLAGCCDRFEIIAGVYAERPQSACEESVKKCCSEARTCSIDANDVDCLVEAFQGVDAVFIVPTATDYKVSHARNYLRAAKRAQVKFVLLLSMTGAEARNYLFADQFRDIEETLQREGIEQYCVLRSNFYMQNLLLYREQLKQGTLPLPIHEGAFNPVDVDDIGRAATAILCDSDKHLGKWYNLTGPEALTGPGMAAHCSRILNTEISWQDIPRAAARTILRQMQVPASEAQGLLEFYDLVQKREKGQLGEQEKNDFKNITGQESTSLEQFLERHKQEILA
jgi:NAD(P)H dehydrogenase (quinone)